MSSITFSAASTDKSKLSKFLSYVFKLLLLIAVTFNNVSYGIEIAIQNPGFERAGANNEMAADWFLTQHDGVAAYKFLRDVTEKFSGTASFKIEQFQNQVFGAIQQKIDVKANAERCIAIRAHMKARDVAGEGGNLFINIENNVRILSQYRSMPLLGTRAWGEEKIVVKLPKGATILTIGAMLRGVGTIWIDDVNINEVLDEAPEGLNEPYWTVAPKPGEGFSARAR